ncbi:MAG: nickel pincer cofactor biosynthesis protein LarC [Planctomycetota bacterium]
MRIAYFDCFAGAGGDMIVASMLDAGLDAEYLRSELGKLGIEGLCVKIERTIRCGLSATFFEPYAPDQQKQRNLADITKLIQDSGISEKAKAKAIKIFNNLALAEGKVHGKNPAEIHFHELGAIDSIVDIISACIGLEGLGIEEVYCSALPLGSGTIKTAHGQMPLPAPATAALLKNVPVKAGSDEGELVTPTAAAVLTTVTKSFRSLPSMVIEAVGYGAGTRDSARFPNVTRLITGRAANGNRADTDTICLLEANSDDSTGEQIGLLVDKLLEVGALDVFCIPCYMKHNRPAVQMCVMCSIEDADMMERMVFESGVTFGIRKQFIERKKLSREFKEVETEFGPIRVKVGSLKEKIVTAKPEFFDCAEAAERHKTTVQQVISAAKAAFGKMAKDGL